MNKSKCIAVVVISSILFAACGTKPNQEGVSKEQNSVWTFFELNEKDSEAWEKTVEKDVPEFMPDVRFECTAREWVAIKDNKKTAIIEGMPIWNVYVTDLNGDNYPEFCATVSIGSGIIDDRVIILDYKNSKSYIISDRMMYDYRLSKHEGKLIITKSNYEKQEEDSITGTLSITDGELVIKYSNGETVTKSEVMLDDLKSLTNHYSLEQAKADGCLVMEDGDVTSGKEVFDDFLNKTSQKIDAKLRVVNYYTLDNAQSAIYITDVVYENDEFKTYSVNDDNELIEDTYKYLIKDEFEANPEATFTTATYYMLVNDRSLTFSEIFRALASSSLVVNGKDISFFPIYQKHNFKSK